MKFYNNYHYKLKNIIAKSSNSLQLLSFISLVSDKSQGSLATTLKPFSFADL